MSPKNQTVPEGNTARFTCTATGFPKPARTWKFNDASLPPLAIEKSTEEGYQLLLPNVTKHMEGTYKCTAINKAGNATSTATLRILGKYLKYQKIKNKIKNEKINICNWPPGRSVW